jgi:membrane dipeptidase
MPKGLEDVSQYPNLTSALLEHGYSVDDIRKIYGGNTLRCMKQIESVFSFMRAKSTLTISRILTKRLADVHA